jgi:hypothetical protein
VGERVAQYLVGAAIGVGASGGVGSGPGADEDLEAAVLGARHRRASRLQSVSLLLLLLPQRACVSGVWSGTTDPDAVDGGQACSLAAAAPTLDGVFMFFESQPHWALLLRSFTQQCLFVSFCLGDKIGSGHRLFQAWSKLC